ncbi:Hypp8259 [Branchiostoma lanceolatum]|uniref:Hypp8259 protein n=1 Tax=Branchiostoma lanceolatum TaxID=7740 RepID=A0A8K0ED59_BRALA|nr:Hypp8259 [Branchiostoma lanceolatum]
MHHAGNDSKVPLALTLKKRKSVPCKLSLKQLKELTKFYTATNHRCEEVEEKSKQRSSFVGKDIHEDGIGPCFARIQYFLRHRFMGNETDLAYLKWLSRAKRDEESNLQPEGGSPHPLAVICLFPYGLSQATVQSAQTFGGNYEDTLRIMEAKDKQCGKDGFAGARENASDYMVIDEREKQYPVKPPEAYCQH